MKEFSKFRGGKVSPDMFNDLTVKSQGESSVCFFASRLFFFIHDPRSSTHHITMATNIHQPPLYPRYTPLNNLLRPTGEILNIQEVAQISMPMPMKFTFMVYVDRGVHA